MEAIFGALNAIYGRLGAIEIQQFASEASASDRHKMNILMQYKNLCEMRCHFFEISCSQTENELSLNEWYVRTHLMKSQQVEPWAVLIGSLQEIRASKEGEPGDAARRGIHLPDRRLRRPNPRAARLSRHSLRSIKPQP
jgi:hypothetical protein